MWLRWLEPHPRGWRVEGVIPGQGTSLGCGFSPCQGLCKRQQWMFLSRKTTGTMNCVSPAQRTANVLGSDRKHPGEL